MLVLLVTAASVQDTTGGRDVVDALAARHPAVVTAWADSGCQCSVIERGAAHGIDVQVVRKNPGQKGAFCMLGPVAEAFLTGSAASGNTRLAADLDELAALRAAHADQPLLAALERAVTFRRWRAGDVRSILAAGAGTSQPRAAGDALLLELPHVPTRPLSAYKIGDVS